MSKVGELNAGRLRVVFQRVGDRIGHSLWFGAGDDARLILASLEGTGETPWPASPPLQQLNFEERDASARVALLIGMAGSSHWSLSCEADPHTDVLKFDVAVRVKQTPHQLGSIYRFASDHEGSAGRRLFDECCEVRAVGHDTHVAMESDLVLAPTATPQAIPATIQWRYSFATIG